MFSLDKRQNFVLSSIEIRNGHQYPSVLQVVGPCAESFLGIQSNPGGIGR